MLFWQYSNVQQEISIEVTTSNMYSSWIEYMGLDLIIMLQLWTRTQENSSRVNYSLGSEFESPIPDGVPKHHFNLQSSQVVAT